MSAEEPVRRGPGRSPASTPERVQSVALRLFLEHGYTATTMEDVAEAAGVGRTTLFRYFSGKPALVWWDLDANYERLDAGLTDAPSTDDPQAVLDQVRESVHRALSGMPTGSQLMRHRWALIDHDATVAAELAVLMMRWATRIAVHARERCGEHLTATAPDAVGYAFLGVTVGAARTWSESREPYRTLAAEMDDALGPLVAGMRAWISPARR